MKHAYKIGNWKAYNQSLVNRGNITFWIDQATPNSWFHSNESSRKGRPFIYSDTAIEICFVFRELFKLPLRQTTGLVKSIFNSAQISLPIPDYTTLSKRACPEHLKGFSPAKGDLHVAIDSTGIKVYGEGEWKMRIHGKSKRRTWRKVHIAIDLKTQEIIGIEITEPNVHDSKVVDKVMPFEGSIKSLRGDGAYDKKGVYDLCAKRKIKPIIPIRSGSSLQKNPGGEASIELRNKEIKGMWRMGEERFGKSKVATIREA